MDTFVLDGNPNIRKTPVPKGYASRTKLDNGKSCKDCNHARAKILSSRKVFKCNAASNKWTNGRGSDILLKAPACVYFEEETKLA